MKIGTTNLYRFTALAVLLIALCATPKSLYAGNLGHFQVSAWISFEVEEGDERDIELEGKNLNGTYSVTGINAKLSMFNLDLGTMAYEFEQEADDVPPDTEFKINLGKLDWTKLNVGVNYRLDIELTADYDEDPSDNKISKEFLIIPGGLTRFNAIDILTQYLETEYTEEQLNYFNAFIPQKITPEGTEIQTSWNIDTKFSLDANYWIGYVDFNKYLNYGHQSSLVLIDSETGDLTSQTTYWRPQIAGFTFPTNEQFTNDLVYGELQIPLELDEDYWTYEITNETNNESNACYLIVTGKGQNTREERAFKNNGRVMKEELTKEANGPQVPAENIIVLENPTAQQLLEEIEKMKGKCTELYFYYGGHGDKENGMVFQDFPVAYYDLFDLIKEQGITNQNYIFDCCYSGKAIDDMKEIDGWEENNITIITSSSKDKESSLIHVDQKLKAGGTYETGVGGFTNSFATQFGDLSADTDKDGKTSLLETANKIKAKNPLIFEGKRLNDHEPQIFTHEKKSVNDGEKVSFNNSGLEFNINSGFGMGGNISVIVDRGEDTVEEPNSQEINRVSLGRVWNIETDIQSDFSVDVGFKLNADYNSALGDNGYPGVVWRMSPQDEWKMHASVVYDKDRDMYLCGSVDHFSQWALARVASDPNSVPSFDDMGIYVNHYPNPFKDAVNIELSFDDQSDVIIDVIDANGKVIMPLAEGSYQPGSYQLIFDGSQLNDGVFFVKMNINGSIETRNLIHIK